MEKPRWRVERYFRWYDLWVGVYIDPNSPTVYLTYFPTLGLKFYFE